MAGGWLDNQAPWFKLPNAAQCANERDDVEEKSRWHKLASKNPQKMERHFRICDLYSWGKMMRTFMEGVQAPA
jgi:hypothetical protein